MELTNQEISFIISRMPLNVFQQKDKDEQCTLLEQWHREKKPVLTARDIPHNLHNDGDRRMIMGRDF